MKKLIKLALFAATTCVVSLSSSARIPADGDCNAWRTMYENCIANGTGYFHGMTCAQIDWEWYTCLYGPNRTTDIASKND